MSTICDIAEVPVAEPAKQSIFSSTDTKKQNPLISSNGLSNDIVGVTGLIVTLSVVLSGVYVFCRFLI